MFQAEYRTHATAKAHSPDVLSPTCSQAPELERGWYAQRSLPAYTRNDANLATAFPTSTARSIDMGGFMARRHAPGSSDTFM